MSEPPSGWIFSRKKNKPRGHQTWKWVSDLWYIYLQTLHLWNNLEYERHEYINTFLSTYKSDHNKRHICDSYVWSRCSLDRLISMMRHFGISDTHLRPIAWRNFFELVEKMAENICQWRVHRRVGWSSEIYLNNFLEILLKSSRSYFTVSALLLTLPTTLFRA